MPRKFKPGEWVKLKGNPNSPKMEVIKYVAKKKWLFGLIDTDTYLECVWYKNGERKSDIFRQNKLIKTLEAGGLFKT
jgi:uncharacterized protein YodC (DUF2158 family)